MAKGNLVSTGQSATYMEIRDQLTARRMQTSLFDVKSEKECKKHPA